MIIAEYTHLPHTYDFIFSKFVMPSGVYWLYIAAVGIFGTISQLLMTKAYSLTKAGIVGTITYSQILFAVIIGSLLGDKLPDIYSWIGMSLIVIAGLLVTMPKR